MYNVGDKVVNAHCDSDNAHLYAVGVVTSRESRRKVCVYWNYTNRGGYHSSLPYPTTVLKPAIPEAFSNYPTGYIFSGEPF